MQIYAVYLLAALAEIGGCFAFWNWLKREQSVFWLAPGVVLLVAFALLLTQTPASAAGRAFAAYGGIYIVSSLAWMWAVEGVKPDRFDLCGAALCLAGAGIIILAPRAG